MNNDLFLEIPPHSSTTKRLIISTGLLYNQPKLIILPLFYSLKQLGSIKLSEEMPFFKFRTGIVQSYQNNLHNAIMCTDEMTFKTQQNCMEIEN